MTTIKHHGNTLNDELEEQTGLLSEIDNHVDMNAKQMKATTGKLDQILNTTSNNCFFCIIAVEIIIIIIILVLF